MATSPPCDSLCSIFGLIDLLLAIRALNIISGMKCGSALFPCKVLGVRGLRVLWSRLQVSQTSVRDVSLDPLPVLSISHCSSVHF